VALHLAVRFICHDFVSSLEGLWLPLAFAAAEEFNLGKKILLSLLRHFLSRRVWDED